MEIVMNRLEYTKTLAKYLHYCYDNGDYKTAYNTLKLVKPRNMCLDMIPNTYAGNLTKEDTQNIIFILEVTFRHVDISLLEDKTLHNMWEIINQFKGNDDNEFLIASLLNVKAIFAKELLRRQIINEEAYIANNDIKESELDISEMFYQLRRSRSVNSKIYKMFKNKKHQYFKDILKSFNKLLDLLVITDERESIKSFVTRINIGDIQQSDMSEYFMQLFVTQNYKEASNVLSYINKETLVNVCAPQFIEYIYKREYKLCSDDNKDFLLPILQTIIPNIDRTKYDTYPIRRFMEFNWERLGKKNN